MKNQPQKNKLQTVQSPEPKEPAYKHLGQKLSEAELLMVSGGATDLECSGTQVPTLCTNTNLLR